MFDHLKAGDIVDVRNGLLWFAQNPSVIRGLDNDPLRETFIEWARILTDLIGDGQRQTETPQTLDGGHNQSRSCFERDSGHHELTRHHYF